MATPLYRFLKDNGSTFYAFPGAAEDLSSSFQNDNYKIAFNKFALLNLKIEDFKYLTSENGPFTTDSIKQITLDNADALINSLRNYVANHEEVLRGSRINNTDFFYDPNEMQTTTERIFWKWLRQIGGVEFEPALPDDEYVDSAEFQVNENLPNDYFKEYLWKERDIIQYRVSNISLIQPNIPIDGIQVDQYEVTITTSTTLKPTDVIKLTNDGTINIGIQPGESREFKIYKFVTTSQTESRNNVFLMNIPRSEDGLSWNPYAIINVELIYEKTIQYIGEISAINNTLIENKAFSEVWAYVPHQNGKSPDILFRTKSDKNYSPGLQFPILQSQDQPEIVGAENFNSPIITNPDEYPGDQYSQFNLDQKYTTSFGYQDRRRGDYYGIPYMTDRTDEKVAQQPYVYPTFDATNIDGITMDFDTSHYSKMNLPGSAVDNFDDFNALYINGEPPKDFKFNAILWYYEVEDTSQIKTKSDTDSDISVIENDESSVTTVTRVTTTTEFNANKSRKATNLYGITFLNGLNKEIYDTQNQGIKPYEKLVTTDNQDGLSYSFSLNLNFNILTENVIETYDPTKVYSLFGFDLYTEVMRRLAQTNDEFVQIIQQNTSLQQDVLHLKSLIYSQTDLDKINFQIQSLYDLLKLYSSTQIVNTDTISVEQDNTQSPPVVKLHTTDSHWGSILQLPVTSLYNEQTNIATPVSVIVPKGSDFLINVANNDQANIELNGKLNIVLDRDLEYKQSCQFLIYPIKSKYNKQLTISIRTNVINQSLYNVDDGYPLISNIDLPIDLNVNPNQELESIFTRWNNIPDTILVNKININQVSDTYYLNMEINPLYANAIKLGDVIVVENMTINYVEGESINLSGQYPIATEITDNNEIQVLINTISGSTIYNMLEDSLLDKREIPITMLTQPAYITFNTGFKITITNVDRISTSINEKYVIEISKFKRNIINEI